MNSYHDSSFIPYAWGWWCAVSLIRDETACKKSSSSKKKKNYSCFLKNENDETLLLVASENEHNVKAVPILEKKWVKEIHICILTSVMLIPGKRLNDS